MSQDTNPYRVSSIIVCKPINRYRKKVFEQLSAVITLVVSVNFLILTTTFTSSTAKFLPFSASCFALLAFVVWKFDRLRTKRFLLSVYRPSVVLLAATLILLLFLPWTISAFVNDWQNLHELVQGASGLSFVLHLVLVILFGILFAIRDVVEESVDLVWWCSTSILRWIRPPRHNFDEVSDEEFEIIEDKPIRL